VSGPSSTETPGESGRRTKPVGIGFLTDDVRRGRSQIPSLGVNTIVDYLEASDGELLAASRSNPDAFAAFYDRYEGSVVGYFARRTGNPEVAADRARRRGTRAGRERRQPSGQRRERWTYDELAAEVGMSA